MKKYEEEKASIVVEATLALPIFLLTMFFLVNVTNLFIVHNKIQFALNAVAHEMSGYSYIYAVSGLKAANKALIEDGSEYTGPIDETVDNVLEFLGDVNQFSGSVEDVLINTPNQESSDSIGDTGERIRENAEQTLNSGRIAMNSIKDRIKNYQDSLKGLGFIALEGGIYKLKGIAAEKIVSFLLDKYLQTSDKTTDEYLKSYDIEGGYSGLDFKGSTFLADEDNKMINLIVTYKINLIKVNFLKNIGQLEVTQRVSVPAWLDGDGKIPREEWKAKSN